MDNNPSRTTAEQEAARIGKTDFQSIHDTFRPRIQRYLTRLAGKSEAEDLAQVVLMRINEGLPRFRGESSLSTWIYRIATNVAADHWRRTRSEKDSLASRPQHTAEGESESRESVDPVEEQVASVEETAIRAEMNACIREFIERLPESYRTVIVLSELEGFSNPEVAAVLDVSLEAVKIRLHRARERLRKNLASGCNFYRTRESELACDRTTVVVRRRVGPGDEVEGGLTDSR